MLAVAGLEKRFGRTLALTGIDFEVAAGERVGFLGRNGAGKSTLLRLLAGFLVPDRGTCRIDGIEVADDSNTAQRHIGFLPEGAPAYPEMRSIDYLTMRARLKGLGRKQARDEGRGRLADVGLSDREKSPVQTLSRGMRQRLGLADALLGDPKLIILDEPTSGLDPAQLASLTAMVDKFSAKRALIFASHRLDAVDDLCGRVVVLRRGSVAFDGSPDDLAARVRPADLNRAFLEATAEDDT